MSQASFIAWNFDPAFQAGPVVGYPPGWTASGQDPVTVTAQPGSAIDLGAYLTSVTVGDQNGDGWITTGAGDTITVNGVVQTVSEVYSGDIMVIDGVSHQMVTFYTTNGNAYAIPFTPGSNTLTNAFAGTTGQTVFILNPNALELSVDELPQLCLRAGTRIATPSGAIPVEALRPGDLVWTLDRGAQPVRVNHGVALAVVPVRIAAGALGGGLPRRDLLLSPHHRVLVAPRGVAPTVTADRAGLAAARHLTGLAGIRNAPGAAVRVRIFHHLLFDRHELILAEGLVVESLYRTAAHGVPAVLPPPARRLLARADVVTLAAAGRGLYGFGHASCGPGSCPDADVLAFGRETG
jgi:hypothetical protein